ncbi:MAG: hypothetical protein QG646_4314 [Euryarchaeota archaeon]|nr:hypothetical protein [Euryarchaeota archaeon]
MSSVKSFMGKMENKGQQGYVFSCPSSICLSFAVWPVDDYTQKEPIGDIRVTINGEKITGIKALKNLSGYFVFSGFPEGKYTLNVESEHYFSGERIVDTSSFVGSKEPLVEVFLKPMPSYPFPERATLVRGVLAIDPDFLPGITVKAVSTTSGREVTSTPDENGEFVIYFKEIIKGKSNVVVDIKGEKVEKTLTVTIEEGSSTYTGIISIP